MSSDLMMIMVGCNDPACGQAPGATFCGQGGQKTPEASNGGPSFAEVLADSTEAPAAPSRPPAPGPSSACGLRADGGGPRAQEDAEGDNRILVGDGDDPGLGEALVSSLALPLQRPETKTAGQDPPGGSKAAITGTGTGKSATGRGKSSRGVVPAAPDGAKQQRPAAGATTGRATEDGATKGSARQTAGNDPAVGRAAGATTGRASEDGAPKGSSKQTAGNDPAAGRAASAAPNPPEGQSPAAGAASAEKAAVQPPAATAKTAPARVAPESSGVNDRAAQASVSVAPADIQRGSRSASAGRPSALRTAEAKAADRLAPDGTSVLKEDTGKKTAGVGSARQAMAETEPLKRPGRTGASKAENRSNPDNAATPAARSRQTGAATVDTHGGVLPARVDAAADSNQAASLARAWTPRSADVPSDVLRQVVDRLGAQLRDGASELRLTLQPESLGHLDLKIASDQNRVSVRIVAETAAAKEIIEANLGQLRTDLSQQGLDVKALDVTVFTANDESRRDTDSRQFSDRRNPVPSARDAQNADPLPAAAVAGGWDSGRHSLVGIYA